MVLIVVAAVLLSIAIAGLIMRAATFESNPFLAMAAFASYPMLAAPVALVLLLIGREWWLSVVAVAVVAAVAFVQVPLYRSQPAPSGGTHLVMMTANLRLGEADAAAVVKLVRAHHVDVLAVQELTPGEAARLEAAGLSAALPHSQLEATSGGAGSGLYSRYALQPVTVPAGFHFAMVAARAQVPGVAVPPTVVATHMSGPWPQSPADWVSDIDRLPSTLRGFADGNPSGSILVGGDFNATTDTAQFRRLLNEGYRDGAGQAGAGHTRSYPADRWYPPLIAIDHVLTRHAVATSAVTLTVGGSDHRALLTTIVLPT